MNYKIYNVNFDEHLKWIQMNKNNWFIKYEYIMNKKIWVKEEITNIWEQKYNILKNTDIGTNEYFTNKIVDSAFEEDILQLDLELKKIVWLENKLIFEKNSYDNYEKTKQYFFNKFNKNLIKNPIEFGIDVLESINSMDLQNQQSINQCKPFSSKM